MALEEENGVASSSSASSSSSGFRELFRELGMGGEKYTQDVIELGMTIMSKGVTAKQATAVIRAIVRFEQPELEEGKDCRIPSP